MERISGPLRKKVLTNSIKAALSDFKKDIKKFFNKTLQDKRDEWITPLITDKFPRWVFNYLAISDGLLRHYVPCNDGPLLNFPRNKVELVYTLSILNLGVVV